MFGIALQGLFLIFRNFLDRLFPLVLWILRFPTTGELQLGWKALHSLAQLSAGGKRGANLST